MIQKVITAFDPRLNSITLKNTDISMTSLDGDIVVLLCLRHMQTLTRPSYIALRQDVYDLQSGFNLGK